MVRKPQNSDIRDEKFPARITGNSSLPIRETGSGEEGNERGPVVGAVNHHWQAMAVLDNRCCHFVLDFSDLFC